MKKNVLIVVVIVVLALILWWLQTTKSPRTVEKTTNEAIVNEVFEGGDTTAAIEKELNTLEGESVDLDAEFKTIDTDLEQL